MILKRRILRPIQHVELKKGGKLHNIQGEKKNTATNYLTLKQLNQLKRNTRTVRLITRTYKLITKTVILIGLGYTLTFGGTTFHFSRPHRHIDNKLDHHYLLKNKTKSKHQSHLHQTWNPSDSLDSNSSDSDSVVRPSIISTIHKKRIVRSSTYPSTQDFRSFMFFEGFELLTKFLKHRVESQKNTINIQ